CARDEAEGRRAAALPAGEVEGAARLGAARADGRAGPGRVLALRAISRDAARGRGVRPRCFRRAHADPPRFVPGAEDARGLRLVGPALGGAAARLAPGAAQLDRGTSKRLLLRATRHRQEPSSDSPIAQSLRARLPP